MPYRYFIQLSFDGTRYHGWQIQKNALTVQSEVNKAMEIALQQKIETLGCCRTDTGVHALQLFAHFDSDTNLHDKNSGHTLQNIVYRLNVLLPKDIAVQKIFPVRKDANARFGAISRTYQYYIHSEKNPFLTNRSFYRRLLPDIEKMNKVAKLLYEYNDFSCFSKTNTQAKSKICKINKAEWKYKKMSLPYPSFPLRKEKSKDKLLVFEIKADRFLRNMVRAIVGTLLEVGNDEKDESDFKKILESKNRSMAGFSVPACGLYLANVEYPLGIGD